MSPSQTSTLLAEEAGAAFPESPEVGNSNTSRGASSSASLTLTFPGGYWVWVNSRCHWTRAVLG